MPIFLVRGPVAGEVPAGSSAAASGGHAAGVTCTSRGGLLAKPAKKRGLL
jgi:hypothetical protein